MQEERERIQQAQRSLEMEKAFHKMKLDTYRSELDHCLQLK